MTVVSRVASVMLAVTILFLYAVTDSVTNNVLAAKKYRNQPHITFTSPDYSLEKIKVDVKGDSEGWSETARWENASGDDLVYVHIFAHVTYEKIIMSSHVRPPDKLIYQITGGKTVFLGARGKAEIERGFYEYQAYRVEEVPCVYIQSYWGDRSFSGVDVVRGAKASDKIVGNHMLQVVVCDQRKKEIGSKDVTEILSSIDLRDAHWSSDWFGADTNSVVPGVTSTETTLDNQATVESKPDINLEGVSGLYRSEITSNTSYMFRHKKHRKLIITLKQDGNSITGTDNSTDSKITGTLEGNTIKFKFWSSKMSMVGEVSGEWKVNDDGSRLEGFWGSAGTGSSGGKWNLTRIE